jgi:hypothetical protein
MRQTLAPGLEVKLERSHDISAVIHADRTADGRILITAMPLLYGTYTVTRGTGTFSLEPPLNLNLAAGWPLFKREELRAAEDRFAQQSQNEPVAPGTIAIPGISPSGTPPPSENLLVRVESALPIETPAVMSPPPLPSKTTKPTGKAGKIAKNQKPTATPSPAAMQVAKANPVPTLSMLPSQAPSPTPIEPADGTALASTAGGGNWKTYPPGRMPLGRLIATTELNQVADRGLSGERMYLKGQFVVNFADANKAVLRPRSRMPDSVMLLAGGNSTRIIVEYPAGYVPPKPGSIVSRDEVRPFEITEVRKQEDGQLNVFAREIMQP